jgi:hypothetical protein
MIPLKCEYLASTISGKNQLSSTALSTIERPTLIRQYPDNTSDEVTALYDRRAGSLNPFGNSKIMLCTNFKSFH